MAWLDSCTSSVLEDVGPHNSIIVDSQNEREELQQDMIISEDVLESIWDVLDNNFLNKDYESQAVAEDTLYSAIISVLLVSGFQISNTNRRDIIDKIFIANGLAPISVSTAIVQNDTERYVVSWSISRFDRNMYVDTLDYTQQWLFSFDSKVRISLYSEVIYNFPWTILWRFVPETWAIFIMTWEIANRLDYLSEQGLRDYIDVIIANELWHLQFQDVISPLCWITRDSIFYYEWEEYTFHQVHELWSDFTSLTFASNLAEESQDFEVFDRELNKLIQLKPWFKQYDLSRVFFIRVMGTSGLSFPEMQQQIIQILESAKN